MHRTAPGARWLRLSKPSGGLEAFATMGELKSRVDPQNPVNQGVIVSASARMRVAMRRDARSTTAVEIRRGESRFRVPSASAGHSDLNWCR